MFEKIKEEVSGKRCFIIGCGLSLRGFDFKSLKDEVTIGINFSVDYIKPTIAMWSDNLDILDKKIKALDCYKVTLDSKYDGGDALIAGLYGNVSKDINDGLFATQNTATAALNLAVLLECSPIYLLGLDMGHDNVDTHFYPRMGWTPNCVYEYQVKFFDLFDNEIYNCSLISKITKFPFKDIREVLNG